MLLEDHEWDLLSVKEKLDHYASTDTEKDDYRARNSFWADILGVTCGGYNQEVDEAVISALEALQCGVFFADNVQDEIIAYLLCSANLAEYGSSPRAAFLCNDLSDVLHRVIERFRQDWD